MTTNIFIPLGEGNVTVIRGSNESLKQITFNGKVG